MTSSCLLSCSGAGLTARDNRGADDDEHDGRTVEVDPKPEDQYSGRVKTKDLWFPK